MKGTQAMSKLILNPEYRLYEMDGRAFCDSLQVAEVFERRHDNVLQGIRETIREVGEEFGLLNFQESYYRNAQRKKQPMFLLTKDAFALVAFGFTGEKAMRFKLDYIKRFNDMESFIKSLIATKMEFPAFTEAVMMAHEEPKHYHYSNEINMIYRIVLGTDAKTFRQRHGLDEGVSLRRHLALPEIQAIETLQRVDIGLLVAMPSFHDRKAALEKHYQLLEDRKIIRFTA